MIACDYGISDSASLRVVGSSPTFLARQAPHEGKTNPENKISG